MAYNGGSIFISSTGSVLDVADSVFAGCGEGGVCALKGGAVYGDSSSKMIFKRTKFIGNKVSGHGGAIYAFCVLELTDSTFISNNAGHGGAIAIKTIKDAGNSFIKDCTFTSNTAISGGGALHSEIESSGSFEITDTKFEGNSASEAGAVYLQDGTTTFNSGITFINNLATDAETNTLRTYGSGTALFTTCTSTEGSTIFF